MNKTVKLESLEVGYWVGTTYNTKRAKSIREAERFCRRNRDNAYSYSVYPIFEEPTRNKNQIWNVYEDYSLYSEAGTFLGLLIDGADLYGELPNGDTVALFRGFV